MNLRDNAILFLYVSRCHSAFNKENENVVLIIQSGMGCFSE